MEMSKNKSQNYVLHYASFFFFGSMSPNKPVENLSVLNKRVIIVFVLDSIKLSGDRCVNALKEYFRKLPRVLKETILLEILELMPLNSYSKWIANCIFEFCCSKFDVRSISPKFHEKFVTNLQNVYYLNLTGAQITEQTLRNSIKKSPSLRALIIPNLATDDVLKDIANLSNLELLNISGQMSISEKGLQYLKSESLRILTAGNCTKHILLNYERDDEILAKILHQLPNLTEIRQYDLTGKSFLKLKSPYVSKLKSICDCKTTVRQLEAIMSICPELEELSLEDPEQAAVELLNEFIKLKKLKITQFTHHETGLNLKLSKLTLETLELKYLSINFNAICLTLEELLIRSCMISTTSLLDVNFRNFRVIELIDSDVKKELILILFEQCNQLQRIVMSNDIGLNDQDIIKLCEKRKLQQLEEMWLSIARQLTSESVVMLMYHCDKLTLLGTLNGWNIEKIEVNYLRCVICLTNKNLNLLYFNCF
ncbi:hypothetical protein ABEB36_002379 [Hypothenemus hampei]|uniref:Uncharacterized protein n=1 Tax=Hypothenemus hampei TaxID=57062 RepID=A0ABD1F5J1_HYPHA